jgi:hypothetical protein
MRVVGHYFVIVLEDPDSLVADYPEGFDRVLAKRIYRDWAGKVGVCVQSTFRNGMYWFLIRHEDRYECFHHRQVRIAPNEMQEMEEDLRSLIEFNRTHGTTYREE